MANCGDRVRRSVIGQEVLSQRLGVPIPEERRQRLGTVVSGGEFGSQGEVQVAWDEGGREDVHAGLLEVIEPRVQIKSQKARLIGSRVREVPKVFANGDCTLIAFTRQGAAVVSKACVEMVVPILDVELIIPCNDWLKLLIAAKAAKKK